MSSFRLAPSLMALAFLRASVRASSDGLPYNPTTILTAANLSYAYIFQPSSQNANQAMLSTLDLTHTISTSQLSTTTWNNTLSFLPNSSAQAYTPIIDVSGNITVVTGNCSIVGTQEVEVWNLTPKSRTQATDGGTWRQITTSSAQASSSDAGARSSNSAANFLAAGLAFSSDLNGDAAQTQLYLFGGMCPFANSSITNWTSAASYSAATVALSAAATSGSGGGVTAYTLDTVSEAGGPIPEAGFTMTGLAPTYSTAADGVTPIAEQQDFLLIGGQTQTAFINMSSLALYSLPQQSWSFIPVQQPTNAKTDLLRRQSTNVVVEPRSGHTAVLSEDGGSVIVMGGWVGDVSNPATPQLAVLTLGAGYGGPGAGQEWSWSIPEPSGPGPAAGSGIYGHGAAMLPGGIILVAGGYSIPAPSSSSKHRRAGPTGNQNVFLYNTSSNTWITSYTPSSNDLAAAGAGTTSGSSSDEGEKIGLGVGLGVGLALLILLILFYIWYTRRLKRKEREREQRLTARASNGNRAHYYQHPQDRGGVEAFGGHDHAAGGLPQQEDHVPSGDFNPSLQMEQAGTTGLFVDIPSPTRGLRKGLSNRPYSYHAAPRYDDGRISRGSNHIHPIAEQEDEDEQEREGLVADREVEGMSDAERRLREVERVLNSPSRQRPTERQGVHTPSPTITNPFTDPSSSPNPLGSHPVLDFGEDIVPGASVRRIPTVVSKDPEGSPSRRPLVAETDDALNWIVFDESQDAAELHTGRVSPSKTDDRTSSSLSDRSHASTTSITRTMSTRTGALLSATLAAWRAADHPESSPSEERSNFSHNIDDQRSQHLPSSRPRSIGIDTAYMTSIPQAGKSTDSFMTARTSFVQLQSEGEALLGGSRRDDPYQRAMAAQSSSSSSSAGPSSTRGIGVFAPILPLPAAGRRQGWMGSLRRALTAMSGSERTSSMLTSSSTSPDDAAADILVRPGTTSPSRPHRYHPSTASSSSAPRRAVSDGGALLSRKRGKKDWDEARAAARDGNDWGEPRDDLDGIDDDDYDDYDENHNDSDDEHDNGDEHGRRRDLHVRRRRRNGRRRGASTSRAAAAAADEDWDVEAEAAKRDFQVMFTVPKTRLRVVNADVERASMRSASDGALSRAGSVQSESRGSGGAAVGSRMRAEMETTRSGSALGTTREEAEEEREMVPTDERGSGMTKGKGKEKAV